MHRSAIRIEAATKRYQPLAVAATAAATGIVADRYFAWPLIAQLAAASTALATWLVVRRCGRDGLASCTLLLAATAVGGAWHHACWRLFSINDLGCYASVEPRPIVCEAILVDAPRSVSQPSAYDVSESETKTRFSIAACAVYVDNAWREAVGRADVQIDAPLEDVVAGDRVRIVGSIERAAPPLNPGQFDFAAHYRSERKLCVLRAARADCVTVVERHSRWNLGAASAEARQAGHRRLLAAVPQGKAGFASALLLGYRDQLERRENWRFFRTGTVHILSISGLHVGMLALFLLAALRIGWMRRATALAITLFVTIGYAAVIDAEPPAMRAVLIVVLVAAAGLSLRIARGWNILAASALIVTAMNPTDLFRAGPQLSFLAAGVLAWVSELPRRRKEPDSLGTLLQSKQPPWRRALGEWVRILGAGLRVSSLIFFVAAPLVAHKFHIVSPISLWLTPLLGLPVALALLFGFLTLTVGAIVPPLGSAFGWLCGTSLSFIDWLVEVSQNVPAGWFWLPGPSAAQTALFYLLLAAAVVLPLTRRRRGLIGGAALTWAVYSLVPHHALPPDVALRTTFISVGHGLSVLVEERDGRTWLYDCGRFGAADRGAQSIAGVLWSYGITHLDAIVISHTDVDHYNGLPYLLEQFRVDRVYVSAVTFAAPTEAAMSIRQAADAEDVPIAPLWEGASWPGGDDLGNEVTILHPPEAGVPGNDNANSLTFEVSVGGRRILLTGDLEGAGLGRLLARPPLDVDVLLAPHHGSPRSDPRGTARWSTPEFVVFSGGGDRRGTARREYESVGAVVLETLRDGAVTVEIATGGTLRVAPFRTNR